MRICAILTLSLPGLPRSFGFRPVAESPFGRNACAFQVRSDPVDPLGACRHSSRIRCCPRPDAGLLPVAQALATHPAATALLGRQHRPGQPGARAENRMPVSAAQFSIGRRPPFGNGGGRRRSGAISHQRSSGRRGRAIPTNAYPSDPYLSYSALKVATMQHKRTLLYATLQINVTESYMGKFQST